ncbi:unnamed protein product [Paramecium octaurelia]|uniref:Uncharacterized protein n=1 Tax=Paramecium octaurelia TaxID=43137 RepID=A0A8S1Y375_PAROT|nr:unnamed protein product [Paramecium octaurelia]
MCNPKQYSQQLDLYNQYSQLSCQIVMGSQMIESLQRKGSLYNLVQNHPQNKYSKLNNSSGPPNQN